MAKRTPLVLAGASLALLLGGAVVTGWHPLKLLGATLGADHAKYLVWMAVVGGVAMVAGGLSLAGWAQASGADERLAGRVDAGSDRAWVGGAMVVGLLFPLLIRFVVLHGLPIVDDEDTYRFASQLLASGRLWAESPPDPTFYDRQFSINDGRWHTQYFLGWPAVMAPFTLLGLSGVANALLASLTVPVTYAVSRRAVSRRLARFGLVLAALAPATVIVAATELSHTACIGFLTLSTWLALKGGDDEAPAWVDVAFGLAFCGAFWIRPSSSLGAGVGILSLWAVGWWRNGRSLRRLAGFAVPSAVLAGLFLLVLKVEHGSFTKAPYVAYLDYVEANHGRFSLFGRHNGYALALDSPPIIAAMNFASLLRINGAFFGWPISLFFVVFARRLWWAWAWVGGFVAVHIAVADVGVETFAPMHYMELFPAILWLTLDGIGCASARADRANRSLPMCIALVAVGISLVFAWPTRLANLSRAADVAGAIHWATDELDDALVFVRYPITCEAAFQPTGNLVFIRPGNPPTLDGRIVWVNHLGLEADRAFWKRRHPDRRPYAIVRDADCNVLVKDLTDEDLELRPPYVGGDGYIEPDYLTP